MRNIMMYYCCWLVVVLVCTTGLVQGQSGDQPFFPQPPPPGPCPTFPVVQNFDLHSYLGRWYEIQRYFAPFQQGDCVTADYQLFPNGSVSVINTQVLEDGSLDSAFGIAELGANPTEGKLRVDFPNSGSGFVSMSQDTNYNVVATDYHNYAVVYSCTFFPPDFKIEFSWILARQPKIPASFVRDLKAWLELVNIDTSRYNPLRQDPTCPRRPI
ncbi:hypothetical protein Pcinc_034260 [Petrolisthes cinctipes]|uniref:Apolipoprotein D n=1 Tax=Petrolisthes cinctipes TaxID=88211 RepID=A0AAE1EQL5_PETCI|nr:hypothetical protein Pcinc_034260 [Petrolisthes cinctipes]